MGSLRRDFQYALRILARHRAVTAVAVCSLALGIGANATIFSFVDALLLRPPSVSDPATLVEIWQHHTTRGNGLGSHTQLSFPDYVYYRDHQSSFSDMGAFTAETLRATWNRDGHGETLQGALVSGNFFSILGTQPAAGRGLLPEDDQPSTAAPVVILSHALWRQRFGADPSVVGRPLTLNGRAFTVVGVGPAGFTGVLAGFAPDFWIPLAMHSALNPRLNLGERRQHWLLGIARLRPGVTRAQANADVAVLGAHLSAAYPDADRNLLPAALAVELVPAPFRGVFGGASLVLMATVALVLLIACANVANLLLSQASTRRREMAVRAALGASRRRLMQQTMAEGALIAALAGVLGVLLALWATPLLWSLRPPSLPLALNLAPDVRVLAFTSAVSVLTGVSFALAPALQQSRLNAVSSLKEGSAQGGSSKSRLRNGLVVAQVAACVVLLVGAGLCVRSLRNASSIDPGFDPHHAVTGALDLESFGYDEARGIAYYTALLERIRARPGVGEASLIDHLPLGSIRRMEPFDTAAGDAPAAAPGAPPNALEMAIAGPRYFEAMRIPILRGRGFTGADHAKAPAVVVINQQLADRYWKGEDPVGRFVTLAGPDGARTRAQIVGVAGTGKYQTLGEDPRPFFYRAWLQEYQPGMQLVVRGQNDASMLAIARDEVRTLDPRIALVGGETLDEHMRLPLFPAQAAGLLLALFGGLALSLAVVGLYGVIAYSVAQRTREIGVRMALGARSRDVIGMVVGQGLVLTGVGTAIGLTVAAGVTRVLGAVLYGISATDPISFGAVAVLLVGVALLASYVPARWAARVDPMRALRSE